MCASTRGLPVTCIRSQMHSVCLLCFFRFTLRLGSGNGCLFLFSNKLKGAIFSKKLKGAPHRLSSGDV
jgi:hypothetical protein